MLSNRVLAAVFVLFLAAPAAAQDRSLSRTAGGLVLVAGGAVLMLGRDRCAAAERPPRLTKPMVQHFRRVMCTVRNPLGQPLLRRACSGGSLTP